MSTVGLLVLCTLLHDRMVHFKGERKHPWTGFGTDGIQICFAVPLKREEDSHGNYQLVIASQTSSSGK